MDILSHIDFEKIDLRDFDSLELNPAHTGDTSVAIGIDGIASPIRVTTATDMALDLAFITRQMLDVVPNPWVAYAIVENAIARLRKRYSDNRIRRDLGFVITWLKQVLTKGRDEQAKQVFSDLLKSNQLHFWLVTGCAGNAIPERIRAHGGRKLRHPDTDETPIRSLFDYAAEEFNDTEAAVALYLDQQDWVLGWFRNVVKRGYSIQGWQPGKVHADFIALQGGLDEAGIQRLNTVQVLEIKGIHLKNEDTDYKQQLFALCNANSQPKPWDEIAQQFANHTINFQVVFENEWQKVLNALFASESTTP
jgi:type III restriction enzyme